MSINDGAQLSVGNDPQSRFNDGNACLISVFSLSLHVESRRLHTYGHGSCGLLHDGKELVQKYDNNFF